MRLAQDLYEGVEIGPEGAVGLITYMRTDSTRVSRHRATEARKYVQMLFGDEFVAKTIQLYGDGKSKNAQEAHEAIRPTDPTRRPEHIQTLSLRRSVQALSAHLAAVHCVADVAGCFRYDHCRFRSRRPP